MIKRIFLTALLLFITYSVFVSKFAPVWWQASQSQFQSNVIKAQKFVYSDEAKYKHVIVGSSLSCRLLTDSIPNSYNLSFEGQSIFDGLKILSEMEELPAYILIEMNVILLGENENFTNSIFSPYLYYPRKVFAGMREDKQPIAVIGQVMNLSLKNIKSFLRPKQSEKSNNIKPELEIDKVNPLFNNILGVHIKQYSQEPSEEVLKNRFAKLKHYVRSLEAKGVQFVFFEMPVNSNLEQLPKAKRIRTTFYANFDSLKYHYIPLEESVQYITTDGLHLGKSESTRYSMYFRTKLFSVLK